MGSIFKRKRPWNLKKAYRETCLCRLCELFRLVHDGLRVVAALLGSFFAIVEKSSIMANGEAMYTVRTPDDGHIQESAPPDSDGKTPTEFIANSTELRMINLDVEVVMPVDERPTKAQKVSPPLSLQRNQRKVVVK